jgi:cytochrome c-type biogenesis protein CcmH/NrfG
MKKKSAKRKSEKKVDLKKEFYFLCACCATVLLLLITSFNINQVISPKQILGTKTQVKNEEIKMINNEIANWENFLKENPHYLEGWIKLAELRFQTGNIDGAKEAYQKAWKIDPNSEETKSLEKKLGI